MFVNWTKKSMFINWLKKLICLWILKKKKKKKKKSTQITEVQRDSRNRKRFSQVKKISWKEKTQKDSHNE